MNYEFGSITVLSPKMKMILEQIEILNTSKQYLKSFIILGESGTGKSTMADYLQKNFYKNSSIKIIKQASDAADFINETAIYTVLNSNWTDLKYKIDLNQFNVVQMPTLKERKLDLPALANFFTQVLSLMNGQAQFKLTEKALEMIIQYGWPGNFHEFESVLEKSYLNAIKNKSNGLIEPQHLKLNSVTLPLEINIGMKLDEIERKYILQTLYFVHQNRTKAAEILGISIRTLRNKINQYREEGFL